MFSSLSGGGLNDPASVDNDCYDKVNVKNNNFDRSVSCIVTGTGSNNEKEQEDNVDDL